MKNTFMMGGDMTVRRLGYGAMRVTGEGIWGPPVDRPAAIALLRRVVALGIDLIDTADAYGPHISEEIIAEALHPYPEGLVIATKGGLLRDGPGQWRSDTSPAHLREAIEGSLRRLKLERIDLYQLHVVGDGTPLEDSIAELARLREAGKIRHIGVSNVSVDELRRAREIVEIVSVQNRYNIGNRKSEAVLEACIEHGLAFFPWYPLAAAEILERPELQALAKERGVSVAQLCLAWLLHRADVIVPIPGTASMAHLEENTAAREITLSAEAMQRLEAAAASATG